MPGTNRPYCARNNRSNLCQAQNKASVPGTTTGMPVYQVLSTQMYQVHQTGISDKTFIEILLVPALIGVQDEDSCGKSETGKTPQEQRDEEAYRPPAESVVLHGNQKRCNQKHLKQRGETK
ncbi:hypothetical protein BHE18_13245 [Rossellomorea aquimaris]|uniref:Uncharacterized protein n=1 Tax=Rossellomorea aquimaris TaxID=189382 RepID=A0A1J6WPM5_9BACI|nr:hypothetical protein BHE18_13245 [Rossellomorea aquimaris]